MSDEQKNAGETSSQFDDTIDDGEILTLSELLDQQREMDEDADAVLGGSDENFCTYSKGYVKRQALYACLTCVPESKTDASQRTGICLACSYKCHDGHDLIELYTKRAFRCDCGTSKILAIRCKLDSNKLDDNDDNTYNQNFSGLYCTCHRPYPDPEDTVDDEMIQCIVCEDWYHSRHLNAKTPDSSSFDEMICSTCTTKHDFLNYYSGYSITSANRRSLGADTTLDTTINVTDLDISTVSIPENASDDVQNESIDTTIKPPTDSTESDVSTKLTGVVDDPVNDSSATGENAHQAIDADINECIQNIIDITRNNVEGDTEPQSSSSVDSSARKRCQPDSDEPCTTSKRAKLTDVESAPSTSQHDPTVCCKPSTTLHSFSGASFWLYDWRTKLCRCDACVRMYTNNGVAFLIDEEDTVKAYQEKGKAKLQANEATANASTSSDATNSSASVPAAMASGTAVHIATKDMDHTSKVEAVIAYNKLKEKLSEFFSTFVESQQVITTKDVDKFFENVKKDPKN